MLKAWPHSHTLGVEHQSVHPPSEKGLLWLIEGPSMAYLQKHLIRLLFVLKVCWGRYEGLRKLDFKEGLPIKRQIGGRGTRTKTEKRHKQVSATSSTHVSWENNTDMFTVYEHWCIHGRMRLRDGVMRRTGKDNDGGRIERKVCD